MAILQKQNILTDKQQAIVALEQYPKYLRAGAGTGKTEVLIQKILHILKNNQNTSLKNFGIITFTNKATDEMRTRLSDSLYNEWLKQINDENDNTQADFLRTQAEITNTIDICTIHGFCERLLRVYGLSVGTPLNFKIKSFRRDTTEIINGIVSKHYENSLLRGIPQYRISKLIDVLLINNSNHGIVIDGEAVGRFTLDTPNNASWNEFKKFYFDLYVEAYEQIEQRKKDMSVLTPNDLIRKAVGLLSNDYIARKVAEQYRFLFIDEFQDTNKDQFDFVNILITKGVKVFLVGDDKQSVYAFRGADVENSRAMNSLISELKDRQDSNAFYLDENFRTDGKLLDVINLIFRHKFSFGGAPIDFPIEPLVIPESKMGTGVDACLEMCFDKPIVDVVDLALSQNIDGRKAEYGDIAVLCRRNFDLDRIADILKNAGLPVEVVGGKGFYRAKEIVDTYKLFNAIINKDFKYKNELIFTNFYKAVKTNSIGMRFGDFISELEVIFRRETVEEILTYIFDKSCIMEFYRVNRNYQAISNLHKLKDISRSLMNKENMQPLQFLEYLYIMISTRQEEDDADIAESERKHGVIKLYSIHKAKGLAFSIVILPCLDNKLNRPITKPKIILDMKSEPPMFAVDKDSVASDLTVDKDYAALLNEKVIEHLAEEVRIFYVACTRAKHKLILSLTDRSPIPLRLCNGKTMQASQNGYVRLIAVDLSANTEKYDDGGYSMKSYRKELTFHTKTRRAYVNITPQVETALSESGIREGLCLVNAMNITASVFINDNESGLHRDFERWLEKLAPEKPHDQYDHNGYEDNADAHLKRSVMGREIVVAVTDGKLDFGTWEQIFYGEFDGMRDKRVLVKIIGE